MPELWRKWKGHLRRDALEADLREEMQTHLEMKAADSGDAFASRRQFGNTALLLEDAHDTWGWPRLENWTRDVRYALRILARKPGFAATVVLTLALGIGSSSTIFSLIDTVLIRPLPYPDSERLVVVTEAKEADARFQARISPGRLEDWNRLSASFTGIAASYLDTVTETGGALPERLTAAMVSPRFFGVLGTPAALGRVFTASEEVAGGAQAVLISDGFWRRRFGGDPAVLGRILVLDNRSYTVTGVMPASFRYPAASTDLWLAKQATAALMKIRVARFYSGIARLKPRVTPLQAQQDLSAVQRTLGTQYPKTDAGWAAAVRPLKDSLVGNVRMGLWLLVGSVSLLLLIACANVACLLLSRLNSRAAEIATRLSLGAGRGAIARQLFAEGLVYSFTGALLGTAAVFAGTRYLREHLPEVPRIVELAVDTRVLALVTAIALLSTILFSLAPVLQAFGRDLNHALTRAGRGLAGGRQRMPRILVAAQLALATALLIGAGLFLRSLVRLEDTPLGFQPERVLALRIGASFSETPAAAMQRHQRTMDALSRIPGATAVAMTTGLSGVNAAWPREFDIAGEPAEGGTLRFSSWRVVTAGFFHTMGIPLLEGQTCRMDTSQEKPFEAIVNRSFADRFFRGRNAIGHVLTQGPTGAAGMRITGIAADAREDGPAIAPQPVVYACGFLRYWPDSDFLIQSPGNPAALANAAREAARAIDPSRPVYLVRPLIDALDGALAQTRFRTLLISLFSGMALLLAAIGLYGVMAYMVSQRTREIGIRMALGAGQTQIVGGILRLAAVLAIAGLAIGILLAAIGSRLLGTLLYGVQPSDVLTHLAATAVLFGVALLACLLPCRRAVSIHPTEALREQ